MQLNYNRTDCQTGNYEIKLYISTFGFKCDWIKNGTPIEVGAANRNNFIYSLRDDSGENISNDNAYWGELTGLYWIWKNVEFKDTDIIGFAHYNKILSISRKKIKSLTEKGYNGIVLKPFKMVSHSYPEDITILCNVLQEFYPQYHNAWKLIYNEDGSSKSENCSNCELFYLTKNVFDAYCSFLFGVLFKIRAIIGDVNRIPYHKRYCAFLGERLLSVYLLANNTNVAYTEMLSYKKFPINLLSKIVHLLRINRSNFNCLICYTNSNN